LATTIHRPRKPFHNQSSTPKSQNEETSVLSRRQS
jgi:hypothetical protein